jgi:hypothetical protein
MELVSRPPEVVDGLNRVAAHKTILTADRTCPPAWRDRGRRTRGCLRGASARAAARARVS